MRAADVRYVIQQALETTGAHPQLVTDNGAQFTAAEFKDLVRRFPVEHIWIRMYHPKSNELMEQFHQSTREALGDTALQTVARIQVREWVEASNETRLYAGLGYLPSAEYYCRIRLHGDASDKGQEALKHYNLTHELAALHSAQRQDPEFSLLGVPRDPRDDFHQ